MHSQFTHQTKSKLVQLMKEANVWDNGFDITANELYENCDICEKFRKPLLRLAVALLLANEFSDVAIDLKHWKNNLYILYMIDMLGRFTLRCFFTNKKPETVIDRITQT